jgi:hypothetical protein
MSEIEFKKGDKVVIKQGLDNLWKHRYGEIAIITKSAGKGFYQVECDDGNINFISIDYLRPLTPLEKIL